MGKRSNSGERLTFTEPMMPTLVANPPATGEWSTEAKFDGWRCQIVIDQGGIGVFTRRGHDWTDRLGIVAKAAAEELNLKSAIIDGELVYPQENGLSDFHALQQVVRSHSDQLLFMAFDLLHLDGEDLRGEPVEERRERLDGFIHHPGGRTQYSDSLLGTPAELFAAAERMGLEGIVCKRRGSPYRSGAATDWVKIKSFIETELEILGVQRAPGKPTMALLGEIGSRAYIGSAFVTFGRPMSNRFRELVEASIGLPPAMQPPKAGVTWLKPGIIGRVKHLRGEQKLRHARLVGFR